MENNPRKACEHCQIFIKTYANEAMLLLILKIMLQLTFYAEIDPVHKVCFEGIEFPTVTN